MERSGSFPLEFVRPHPLNMKHPGRLIIDHRVPYGLALELQTRFARERAEGARPDVLWLLEHEPVFTLGRTTHSSAWGGGEKPQTIAGIPTVDVKRGGSITYHGPGQLIAYPIVELKQHGSGPKVYVRMLEEVILRSIQEWGITGERVGGLPGVWVGANPSEKLASIGVRISRGITTHGFALNVATDLPPFSAISPCGIEGCRVTSMSRVLGQAVDVSTVMSVVATQFADVFGLAWTAIEGARAFASGASTGTPAAGSYSSATS